eukprot:9497156-Pyramimonas_sp.AAC.1
MRATCMLRTRDHALSVSSYNQLSTARRVPKCCDHTVILTGVNVVEHQWERRRDIYPHIGHRVLHIAHCRLQSNPSNIHRRGQGFDYL